MSDDLVPHLREVRDALRSVLVEQIHAIDQLLQRSAVLLAAASVLAGLLATLSSQGAAPVWRQWTTRGAFAALLISLFAGIIAVWPRQVGQQAVLGAEPVRGVHTYASMKPEEFLRQQCDDAYTTMTTGGYANIIRFRRRMFRVEAVSLVIGGVLIAVNSLAPAVGTPPPQEPAGKHLTIGVGCRQVADGPVFR